MRDLLTIYHFSYNKAGMQCDWLSWRFQGNLEHIIKWTAAIKSKIACKTSHNSFNYVLETILTIFYQTFTPFFSVCTGNVRPRKCNILYIIIFTTRCNSVKQGVTWLWLEGIDYWCYFVSKITWDSEVDSWCLLSIPRA